MSALVEMRDVWRVYEGAVPVPAVRGLSLRIEAGELVAITGSSGSGKSTLLGLLGCLDTATSGTIRIAGMDVARASDGLRTRLRRDLIGFVFQQFHLVPHLSALANVESALLFRGIPRAERRARALRSLERVGLLPRATHLPSRLSGGEQQRVAIARALVTGPALLLADEPTGNLDSTNTSRILDLLAEIPGEHTAVVIVTHERDVAARCQRVVELRDGQLFAEHKTATSPPEVSA